MKEEIKKILDKIKLNIVSDPTCYFLTLYEEYIDESNWGRVTFINSKKNRELIFSYIQGNNKLDITILDISDRMQDHIKVNEYLLKYGLINQEYLKSHFYISELSEKEIDIKLKELIAITLTVFSDIVFGTIWRDNSK
jgi:hypothetical protein